MAWTAQDVNDAMKGSDANKHRALKRTVYMKPPFACDWYNTCTFRGDAH
jgi:hypothetical protein